MRLLPLILALTAAATAQPLSSWAAMSASPSVKVQDVFIDASGCLWVTEANAAANTGGIWRSDNCGSNITTSTTFSSVVSGSPTAGGMVLNSSNQVVIEPHNGAPLGPTAGPVYRASSIPVVGSAVIEDFVAIAADPSSTTLWFSTHGCASSSGSTGGTTTGGLFKSTDGGTTLARQTNGANQSGGICDSIVVHPTNGRVYADSESAGIFYWDGATWTNMTTTSFCSSWMGFLPDSANAIWSNDCNANPHKCDITAPGSGNCPSVTIAAGVQTRITQIIPIGSGCATPPYTTNCYWQAVGKEYSPTNQGPRTYYSLDLGVTWTANRTGLPAEAASSEMTTIVYSSFDGYCYGGADGANGGLYRIQCATVPSGGGTQAGGKLIFGGQSVRQ